MDWLMNNESLTREVNGLVVCELLESLTREVNGLVVSKLLEDWLPGIRIELRYVVTRHQQLSSAGQACVTEESKKTQGDLPKVYFFLLEFFLMSISVPN